MHVHFLFLNEHLFFTEVLKNSNTEIVTSKTDTPSIKQLVQTTSTIHKWTTTPIPVPNSWFALSQ
jgi:hypothetical protein